MKVILMIIISMALNSSFAGINEVHKILIEKTFDKKFNEEDKNYAIDWFLKILEEKYIIDENIKKTLVCKSLLEKEGDEIDGINIKFSKNSINFDCRVSIYLFVMKFKDQNISQNNTQEVTNKINMLANNIFSSVLVPRFKTIPNVEPPDKDKSPDDIVTSSGDDILKDFDKALEDNGDGTVETEEKASEKLPQIDLKFTFDKEVDGYKLFKLTNLLDHHDTWLDGLTAGVKGNDIIFMGKQVQGLLAGVPNDIYSLEDNKVWFNKVLKTKDGKIINP